MDYKKKGKHDGFHKNVLNYITFYYLHLKYYKND